MQLLFLFTVPQRSSVLASDHLLILKVLSIQPRTIFKPHVSLVLNFYYIYIVISQGIIASPFGPIKLEKSEKGLRSLQIMKESEDVLSFGYDQALQSVVDQLNAYFNGTLQDFKIAYDLRGHPEFYIRVWRVLSTIPYGKTRTYSDVAHFLQKPSGARAVGNASAHNPLVIVIPCHRVLGKNGRLTGYMYGKDIKRQLLQHESPAHFSQQGKFSFDNE